MNRVLTVVVIALAVFTSGCFPYRYHNAACRQRGQALEARLNTLRRDADEQLMIGTKKDVLVQFCERHGLKVTVASNRAYADFSAKGCAPSGCGTDDFTGGLRVDVDKEGTIVGKPYVGGIYSNCL